jgi:hypothetical protein
METPLECTGKSKQDLWRDRIDAQRASGQSVRDWCKANDTPEHSFYWWRLKLGLSPARKPRRSSKPISFARVVVDPPIAEPPLPSIVEPFRFRFSGGHELILPASLPIEQVAKLVRALEARA